MIKKHPIQNSDRQAVGNKAEEAAHGGNHIPKTLLRRQGLAKELDCSLRTVDKLQTEGMPCIFIGRSRRFVLAEVIAWLKRRGGRA